MSTKRPTPQETSTSVDWGQFRRALGVFSGDYNIVGHPETPHTTPFSAPNVPDAQGLRRYSVTQILPETTEADFRTGLAGRPTLFIGCMDKDAVGPAFESLKAADGEGSIAVISMGGGIVQPAGERESALGTVLRFLGSAGKFTKVVATGHDHGCGLVKVATGGIPLPDRLQTAPASTQEGDTMKGLIAHGVETVRLRELFPGAEIIPGLVHIDRQGGALIDTNFAGVTPTTLVDIAAR